MRSSSARRPGRGPGHIISEDPIRFAGGDVNLYAYVVNSPTNFTDASGLASVWHIDKNGLLKPGPPPTGGRKDKGSGGGPASPGMLATATTADRIGIGALIGLGLLGALAAYTAMNPPKATPIPDTITCEPPSTRDRDKECIEALRTLHRLGLGSKLHKAEKAME